MRLVTFRAHVEAEARLGAIVDDVVVDLSRLGIHAGEIIPDNMLDFIELGTHAVTAVSAMLLSYQDK